MNRGIIALLAVFTVFLFYSCSPLEGEWIIAPGGGRVFYDKGSYRDGWRYLESSPKDAGKLSGADGMDIDFAQARELANSFSQGGYKDWRLPTDDEFKRLWKCFLNEVKLDGNHPYAHGGLQYKNNIYYVTSDGHAYRCETKITTTTDSNGNEKKDGKSKLVQGSGKYESGCTYIVHPVRGF